MDAGEASLVGIGTWQEVAGLDAVSGPGEMEALEGTAEGELGLQVAVLGLKSLDLGFQIVDVRLGLPTARTILADHDARCGNVHTFPATGRPTATGVAGSRQGPEVRAAVSRGTASRRGEGSGGTAEGKGDTPAQRPEPGRGGRPQGRRTFGSVKSSTALLSRK